MNKQYISWFEIPVSDFDRAVSFYKTVFNLEIIVDETIAPGFKMGIFPSTAEVIGGALVQGQGYVPTEHGPVVYLNGGNDLSEPLAKIEAAGGKIVVPKTKITDQFGYFAFFLDSEGNRLALHSMH